jgi:hypothetical protein
MFPHGGSANELTRWATAASLVEKGSFEISWTEPLIGPNVDTAKVGDRVYSNKAPGTAILAVPAYAIVRPFIGQPDASNIRISWFAMRFLISTLPLFLLALWLFARETDELSLATLLFATPLFVYSLLFFSHVFVAVVLYLAFRIIYDQRYIMPWHAFVSGLLCGLSVISEFPAVFPVAVFGAGLLFSDRRERFKRLLYFAIGGLPFVILLAWYNYALFGSPLSMSYAHESFPEWAGVASQGAFGIGWPTPFNFYLLLFSPSRGLLFTAPILVFSIITFFLSRERNTLRNGVKIFAVIITVIFLSGHGAAHGGWAFGPRYLILLVPLLLDSFFDGETYEMSNLWQGFLFGISIILCVLPALTFPFAPPEFAYPHRDFWMRLLVEEHWFVPNLANVISGSSSVWTMIPVFLAFMLAVYIVFRSMRRQQRFLIGLAAALVAVTIYFFVPFSSDDDEGIFRRATIAERFFKPGDRLRPFETAAANTRDFRALSQFRQAEWTIAEARAFAPDDFPYLPAVSLSPSPTDQLNEAVRLQASGDTGAAEQILRNGIERYPFAKCELATDLAIIYYTTDRRDQALSELEEIQPLVDKAATPGCIKSQFLLGALYGELGRNDESAKAFNAFLANSDGTSDQELINFRKQLGK